MDLFGLSVKHNKAPAVCALDQERHDFVGARIDDAQLSYGILKIVEQGAIAPNGIVNLIVRQIADTWMARRQLGVQLREDLGRRPRISLVVDALVKLLPCRLVIVGDGRHRNGNVIAHIWLL